jgi:5-methylcytosine-specific restriction endonuclease McrA
MEKKYRRGKYTTEQLKEACKTSLSRREVMNKLRIIEAGGNYSTIKRKIHELQIDITHWTKQGWNVGARYRPVKAAKPISDFLKKDSHCSSHHLKKRLIKELYFEHKCYKCSNTTWLNQLIPLELEHIDGDHNNNELNNLTLLCPNCHAQTPTYRNKKRVAE